MSENDITTTEGTAEKEVVSRNFIEQAIDQDLAEGVYDTVHTRFPPEPNGYLHIGHAKSILLNAGLAEEYGGKFNLRFDDTNPTKEKNEFVESIKEDVRWLGADYEDRLFFASDYFEQMYEGAVKLIKKGKAYVSDLTARTIRTGTGSWRRTCACLKKCGRAGTRTARKRCGPRSIWLPPISICAIRSSTAWRI